MVDPAIGRFAFDVARWFVSLGTGLLVALAAFTYGCDDSGDPSWERCTSVFGNATVEWSGPHWLVPGVLGVATAAIAWLLITWIAKMLAASARLET